MKMTFRRVIFPLTIDGVKTGCQVVFIPALSLFMLTRLIAGNRVITLGTAIEQHFLVTQDWGMGSTIAVFLIIIMFLIMFVTAASYAVYLKISRNTRVREIRSSFHLKMAYLY